MNTKTIITTIFAISATFIANAQRIRHTSEFIKAYDKSAVQVPFAINPPLTPTPSTAAPKWGMDTAWDSADNVTRGTNYIGKDVLAIGRVSFQPSDLVDDNGELSTSQKSALQSRLSHIGISGVKDIMLNCDHEALNKTNYYGKPYEWYRVIKASVTYARSKGFNVVSIAPFNEPDYTSWGEGTQAHFKEICRYISEDADLAGIRISAGNTLNCDQALSWYNYMKPYVTEGNTHQLAGSFDNYANFFKTVRKDGNHASADEMHNVCDALVAVHYGLQSGVWWGWDGVARGEYCRASSNGEEIGYGENRKSWSAAAVYKYNSRGKDEDIRAFLGTSERQATNSSYEFMANDRPAYFDGYGPVYSYGMAMPGGTAYDKGQSNAERMIQITYGEDVPAKELKAGTYVIMNRNSMKCMGYYNGARGNGISVVQNTYTGKNSNTHQQWLLRPVSERIGGDFSYFYLKSQRDSTQYIDLKNWSTSVGGTIIAYAGSGGALEQWFAEYADNGDYYIRSRHSGLYLQVKSSKVTTGATIEQGEFTGEPNQRWRFLPIDAALELDAPSAPTGLQANGQSASVMLTWNANAEKDIDGYMVYRKSNSANQSWDCIGRQVADTMFVDNFCSQGEEYIYKVKAIDHSGNISEASDSILAICNDKRACIAHYDFEQTLTDESENMLDASIAGSEVYNSARVKTGSHSITLDGTNNYLLLPPAVGGMEQMTIAMWVYCMNSASKWQRIFDFGNDTDHYMFLTYNSGSGLQLALKNGGDEQTLSSTSMGPLWRHVAVTLSPRNNATNAAGVCIYVDGELAASSNDITIRPSDFMAIRNYIGRSQFDSDPLFKGYVDDVRIYNYPLNAAEIAVLAGKGLKGDANGDGVVDVADITTIASYILGNSPEPFIFANADVNDDGNIDVADITGCAKLILEN
ncbi:MAG: LamG-like jellyroll fold domain-containing protein [Prevotellaceae bacterium]|nr:LamG-like jellyroll fold domain-containing protein [Prevotellaceae bacterium]